MTLFGKKGKPEAAAAPKGPAFSPIDRGGLLGLLDQVVNGGQSGVLELREPRGTWVYAFQGGALTHASGGRVRGARQAFDLLWEFQYGEFMFSPGASASPAGNLYIDKARLLDLLHRSQAVLQGPSAPYIPPDQQRPIAPVPRPYSPPVPGQMPPQWQPGAPSGQVPTPAWGAQGPPQAPGYPVAPYPGPQYPQGAPAPGYPPPPQGYPPQGYPTAPPPGYPQPYPQQPAMPPQQFPQQPMPAQPMPQQAMPPQAPFQPQAPMAQPPAPPRPVTPGSFSVPPMPIPRKREAAPIYQAQAQPAPAPAPAPAPPVEPVKPKDDLAALRASLVAQAPLVAPAPTAPTWKMRTPEGTVAPPPPVPLKGAKGKAKKQSKLVASIKVELIKFLLWTMERKYSPEDHWTLKDAFEISTMELRDQFIGAFSQISKPSGKAGPSGDDDMDDMAAGRMRGRARRH